MFQILKSIEIFNVCELTQEDKRYIRERLQRHKIRTAIVQDKMSIDKLIHIFGIHKIHTYDLEKLQHIIREHIRAYSYILHICNCTQ